MARRLLPAWWAGPDNFAHKRASPPFGTAPRDENSETGSFSKVNLAIYRERTDARSFSICIDRIKPNGVCKITKFDTSIRRCAFFLHKIDNAVSFCELGLVEFAPSESVLTIAGQNAVWDV